MGDPYKATTDFWSNAGYDPSKANYGLTSSSMTSAWNKLNPGVSMPGSIGGFSTGSSTPAYDRVSSIPGWLPAFDTHELTDQYNNAPNAFDYSAFDVASQDAESNILTTGLNAGRNAAAEYANKARQSGGSGMGAGLIKAQAAVGARKTAGDMALDRERFNASQREKAATLSTQIATTLGNLRSSYLSTIVDYATKSDSTSAEYRAKMAAVDASNRQTDEQKREFDVKNPPPPSQFDPGYVPSFGPIRPASINGQTMPNTAFGSYPTSWLNSYGHGG